MPLGEAFHHVAGLVLIIDELISPLPLFTVFGTLRGTSSLFMRLGRGNEDVEPPLRLMEGF